ncbi:MAG: hypothetical protein B6240_04620, partial [Desulfobacteraceae bacterium 4572_87]
MTVKRITFLQEMLGVLGLGERLGLSWISSAEAQKFVQVVTDFTEINNVKTWLENGTVDVFLGYKEMDHHPLPHCFTREHIEEVEDLVVSLARYPLEKIATHMTALEPDIKIGMLARDCNDRALNVLYLWNQIKAENVKTLAVNCCPSRLKKHGDCSYLEPKKMG